MEPFFKTELGDLYHGETLETLSEMPDESADCCITSPPYWNLRDYGTSGQLGNEPDFHEYLNKLWLIFYEVYRV